MQNWNLTINLANRSGEFARVTDVIAKAGVNIEGFCCVGHGDHASVNFLVTDEKAAVQAFEQAGIKVEWTTEVLVETIEHRPGTLAEVVRRVSEHNVDLTVAYLATNTRLVLGARDMDALRTAWTARPAAARG